MKLSITTHLDPETPLNQNIEICLSGKGKPDPKMQVLMLFAVSEAAVNLKDRLMDEHNINSDHLEDWFHNLDRLGEEE